jgi:outer membrane receptor protein involved in Fe transport
LFVTAGLLPATTAAQTTPPTEPADAQTVTITGEKVRRDRQQTYSSVGVLTGRDLEDLGIADVRSAIRLLPNVNSSPSNNGNNGITIRGVNSEGLGEPTGNPRPLMALVVDGAVQSFNGVRRGARGLWDAEQVEVFRGPQSALQGRGALAGAVMIRTRDPSFTWEGALNAVAGIDHQREAAFMLSGPILGRELAFRVATETINEQHGITYGDPRLEDLDDGRHRALRAKLLWKPAALPGFTLKLTALDSFDSPAVTAVSPPDPFQRLLRQAATGTETREITLGTRTLDAEWRASPRLLLTSTTSGIRTTQRFRTYTPDYTRNEVSFDDDLTQDLRVLWQGEKLEWLAGLFAGRFRNERDSVVRFRFGEVERTVQDLESTSRITNHALYGQVRWAFAPQWTLTAGLRRDRERFEGRFFNRIDAGDRSTDTFGFGATLPRAELAWQFMPEQSVALTFSRGYRAGFFEQGRLVEPEFLDAVELAWRSRWWDRKLVLNANFFGYDWRSQQIAVIDPDDPLNPSTENAGRSRVIGFEIDAAAMPVGGVRLGARLGLLRTKLVDFRSTQGDFSGNQFPEAPRVSASLNASWRGEGGWFAAGDWSYKGAFFGTSDLANRPDLRTPWNSLLNVRGGYEAEHWSLVLSADNLADTDYITGRDIRGGFYVADKRRLAVTFNARW